MQPDSCSTLIPIQLKIRRNILIKIQILLHVLYMVATKNLRMKRQCGSTSNFLGTHSVRFAAKDLKMNWRCTYTTQSNTIVITSRNIMFIVRENIVGSFSFFFGCDLILTISNDILFRLSSTLSSRQSLQDMFHAVPATKRQITSHERLQTLPMRALFKELYDRRKSLQTRQMQAPNIL